MLVPYFLWQPLDIEETGVRPGGSPVRTRGGKPRDQGMGAVGFPRISRTGNPKEEDRRDYSTIKEIDWCDPAYIAFPH